MDTKIPSPIPFTNFELNYSPLPLDYPRLPLASLEFQPAAYTQGNEKTIYVTIIVPLPKQMFIVLPSGIGYIMDGDRNVYTCEIQLMNDLDSANTGRLGIMSFSIDISEGMSCEGRWDIQVIDPESGGGNGNSGGLGKVVMDANILPTLEEPKA